MKIEVLVCAISLAAVVFADTVSDDAALDEARKILATLTIEEKAMLTGGSGTMSMAVPKCDREWIFSDSSHTVRTDMERWTWDYTRKRYPATVLPTLSALAATWNRDLAAAFGHVIGEEARARGKDQMLGPGVNIMRDPRCGRNWEYLTEDPCLAAKLIVPEIRAIQSHGVAATVKHFCLNNQELDRNNVDTICDERTLNEIYLPAFEAAVVDAGAWCVMTAYNKVDGDWCSENAFLQRGILRDRWHFPGMIVTDWGGAHTTVKSALNGGGVEMNRGQDIRYFTNPKAKTYPLADAVRKGEVPEAVLDEMALHTLWTMAKTKFFRPEEREKGSCNTPEHQKTAREIGEEAIVLLKNDNGVLPLDPNKTAKIVVVGKLADTRATLKGWSAEGNPPYEITPLGGLKEYFARGRGVEIVQLPLVAADNANRVHDVIESSIGTFDTSAKDAGMSVRAWEVSYFDNTKSTDGTPVKTGFARQPGLDIGEAAPFEGMNAANFAVRWHTRLAAPESGDYTFSVDMDHRGGTTIVLDGEVLGKASECDTVTAQKRLEAGKVYDFSVTYEGDTGVHRMKFGWRLPSESGSLEDVREAAKTADAVLVFTGTEVGHGQALECEGGDRPNLKLPEGHDAAIATLLSWNIPNLVVITHSGAPLELPWADAAATILHQPYLGQEAGRALARVLFGDVNPSGRLPCTWPRKLADTPVEQRGTYTAARSVYNEGVFVGYRWYDAKGIKPLFPFGYGLSYTTFAYDKAEVSVLECADGPSVKVHVGIANTGKRAGKETVQLYVAPVNPKIVRPVKELKDFAKVALAPGEAATIEFELGPRDFAYWDVVTHSWRVDAGEYEIIVGNLVSRILVKNSVYVLDC